MKKRTHILIAFACMLVLVAGIVTGQHYATKNTDYNVRVLNFNDLEDVKLDTGLGTPGDVLLGGTVLFPYQGGTGLASYSVGEMLYASGPGTLSRLLASGSEGQVVKMTSGIPAWGNDVSGTGTGGGEVHGILNSDWHTDVLLASVSANSLIYGGEDTWQEFVGPTVSSSFLQFNGTSLTWDDYNDRNTTYTAGDMLTLTGTDFDIDDPFTVVTLTGTHVSASEDFSTPSGQITSLSATTLNFPDDSIAEADISFSTACAAGSHYYLNGTNLACETDDDTTYTGGDHLTLTLNDFDVDDDFLLNNGDTGTWVSLSADFEAAQANIASISGTNLWGFSLTDCDADNQTLAWSDTGVFSCGDDDNTTYTGGDNLTLTGTDFDVDDPFTIVTFTATHASISDDFETLSANITSASFIGTGSVSFAGMLDIEGDVNIGNADLRVDASSGNVLIANGNVGIGTTAPGYKLEVIGTARLSSTLQVGGDIDAYGRMMIGFNNTSTPGAPVFTFNGDTNTGIYTDLADTLEFSTASTERLRIGSTGLVTIAQNLVVSGTGNTTIAGNVGIGTTSPDYLLDVAGQITASSSFINGLFTGTHASMSGDLDIVGDINVSSISATTYWGAGLVDCDTAATSKLLYSDTGLFSCGTDSNTTYTGGDNLTLTGTDFDVDDPFTIVTFLTTHASISDDLNVADAETTSLSAGTFAGAGLADCDTAATSKLLWSDTGVFSCGTDANTGGAGGEAHGLFNPDWHTDVSIASTSGGSLIVGGETTWQEMTIGTSNSFLLSDGTSASWNDIHDLIIGGDLTADWVFVEDTLAVDTIDVNHQSEITFSDDVVMTNTLTGLQSLTSTIGLFTHTSISDDLQIGTITQDSIYNQESIIPNIIIGNNGTEFSNGIFASASDIGVYGYSDSGNGLQGYSVDGYGVKGYSVTNAGLYGYSETSWAVYANGSLYAAHASISDDLQVEGIRAGNSTAHMYDVSSEISIDWDDRSLSDTDGNPALLWEGPGYITMYHASISDDLETNNGIITSLSATTLNFPADSVQEADIDFDTACAAGNHFYLNGNDLACEADANTTYTAGDNLTLTLTDFDLDPFISITNASISEDLDLADLNATSASFGTMNATTITEGGIAVLNNDEMDASSELITIFDDETGSGHIVFDTSPEFTTSFTTTGVFAINPGGALTIGDNGDTLYLNSNDWDIGTTGDMTGIGAITMDGVFVVASSTAAFGGNADFYSTASISGVFDFNSTGTIVNIGNAGTDFTSTGGLTLANGLSGTYVSMSADTDIGDLNATSASFTGDIQVADILVTGGNINTGNIALVIGDATTDTIQFYTDSTGNGEYVFQADGIGDADIDWGSGAGQVDLADIPGGVAPASVFDLGAATSFELPNVADPTVDAAGEIAIDTTQGQLTYFWETGGQETLMSTMSFQFVIASAYFDNADGIYNKQMPENATIVEIHCHVDEATSQVVELLECDSAGANCSDVDSSITCAATDTASDGSLSNPSIDALDHIVASHSQGDTTGTIDFVTINVIYKWTEQ